MNLPSVTRSYYILPLLLLVARTVSGLRAPSSSSITTTTTRATDLRLSGGVLQQQQQQRKRRAAATNVIRMSPTVPSLISDEAATTTVPSVSSNDDQKERRPFFSSSAWTKVKRAFYLRSTSTTNHADVQGATANNNSLTLKERLAKKGMSALLAFSMLSNMTLASFSSFAWYGFSMKTGMSPLYPGQWKPYLAVQGASMAMDSLLTPIRLVAAIALAPTVERAMNRLQHDHHQQQQQHQQRIRFWKCSKPAAVAIMWAVNIVASLTFFAGTVTLASALSGVPLFFTTAAAVS